MGLDWPGIVRAEGVTGGRLFIEHVLPPRDVIGRIQPHLRRPRVNTLPLRPCPDLDGGIESNEFTSFPRTRAMPAIREPAGLPPPTLLPQLLPVHVPFSISLPTCTQFSAYPYSTPPSASGRRRSLPLPPVPNPRCFFTPAPVPDYGPVVTTKALSVPRFRIASSYLPLFALCAARRGPA